MKSACYVVAVVVSAIALEGAVWWFIMNSMSMCFGIAFGTIPYWYALCCVLVVGACKIYLNNNNE